MHASGEPPDYDVAVDSIHFYEIPRGARYML